MSLFPIVLLLIITASRPADHALYIGVINIEHQEGTSISKMAIKVFSDDLQNGLKNEFNWKELPNLSVACDVHSIALQQYFQNHLTIWINKEPVYLQLQTCENLSLIHISEPTRPY